MEFSFLENVADGNTEIMKDFINDFNVERKEFEENIKKWVPGRECVSIKLAVHKFKSCLRIFSDTILNGQLESLAQHVSDGNWQRADPILEEILQSLIRCDAEIKQFAGAFPPAQPPSVP